MPKIVVPRHQEFSRGQTQTVICSTCVRNWFHGILFLMTVVILNYQQWLRSWNVPRATWRLIFFKCCCGGVWRSFAKGGNKEEQMGYTMTSLVTVRRTTSLELRPCMEGETILPRVAKFVQSRVFSEVEQDVSKPRERNCPTHSRLSVF